MSIDVALGGTAASVGLVAAGANPDASRPTSLAACRRLVEAVSTHCMALGRAATRDGVPSLRRFLQESPDRPTARIPRRRWSRSRRWPITHRPASLGPLGAGFQPAVLVRESNPRQPDSRSGALSTELTWLTRPSVRTHERNTRNQPPRPRTGQRAPLAWPYQRGRWESNPLGPGCSRLPCRLAPASRHSVSSPGVEPGLRPSRGRVQIPHTPRTFAIQRPAEELNPVLQFRRLPCCPAHPQGLCVSIPTRNRTWTWSFGGSDAIRYTIGTNSPEPTTGLAPASSGLQDRCLPVRPRRH